MSIANVSRHSPEYTRKLQKRYTRSRAKLEEFRRIENGQSAAVMFAALAYGDALDEIKPFALASKMAKLFCITALFVIPNVMVIYMLL